MTALTRLPDWPDRLVATIERHRKHAFVWGAFDCATLFADCVVAVTGFDPLCDFDRWSSERDALRLLSLAGCRSMREFCNNRFQTAPVSFARRGDLVLPAGATPLMCPAVVVGAEAVSRDAGGWVVAPLGAMTHAWKVG